MNVLLFYLVYPLAMGTYFRRALERRTDIDLRVAGPYSGAYIPWLGGMNLPFKYAKPPDIPLPFPPQGQTVPYEFVKAQLGDWKPDLVLCVDAGIRWDSKPTDGVVAHVATDPHVLDYTMARSMSDKFFNMQKAYSLAGDIWLPYAYDPTVWYPNRWEPVEDHPNTETKTIRTVDAAMVGMPYSQRVEWVEELRRNGVSVIFENGPVFDEARELYHKASIGLNWSSLLDLNARVFELMALGLCPVINRVPDLDAIGFVENRDYLGFSNLSEAVEKVLFAKNHPQAADTIRTMALNNVAPHTYDARIGQILQECGF